MKKFLHAGGSSAVAAALILGLGFSSAALAQVQALPVVQAVVSTPPARAVRPAPKPKPLPLPVLVDAQGSAPVLDEQGKCLATAVYFESMGESLEGQLAVAEVVINRAESGQYPSNWCAVVKQKAQFSLSPRAKYGSPARSNAK